MASQISDSNSNHPRPFIHNPNSPHTHNTTLILLHGTSQTGPELASTLLSFPIPSSSTQTSPSTLSTLLPSTRILFPTGALKPTTVFAGKETHAWFDIHSFSDRTIGEDDQIPGLRESVSYVSGLVREEVEVFVKRGVGREEAGKRVVVVGFSAGCAVGVVGLLSGEFEGIGAFVGLSGWLPFRRQICGVLERAVVGGDKKRRAAGVRYLEGLLGLDKEGRDKGGFEGILETPVLLCHGEKDTKVKYEWGGEMRHVFKLMGMSVDFKSYPNLEHWFHENEMSDVVRFLNCLWLLLET